MKLSQLLAIYAKNNRLLRFTFPSPNISIANISARKIHSLFFRQEPRTNIWRCNIEPRFYVSTSKSIIKALINM
ncbi:TPA: hypothetical protein ACM7CW_001845, partial [Escherichia coli]